MRHPVAEVRAAMNRVKHPALYCVDTISSLASYDFRMDEWGVDLVIGGSQKGLMMPPGMSFTAINARAWEAALTARSPRRYWDWRTMVEERQAAALLRHGADPVLLRPGSGARHDRGRGAGERVRAPPAPRAGDARLRAGVVRSSSGGGPEIYSLDAEAPRDSLTAVLCPAGHDADKVRAIASERYSVALGRGLGALQGRVFRIGHMGDLNEPMLLGALGGIELALAEAGMPHARGGVEAAMEALKKPGSPLKAAGTTVEKSRALA